MARRRLLTASLHASTHLVGVARVLGGDDSDAALGAQRVQLGASQVEGVGVPTRVGVGRVGLLTTHGKSETKRDRA